VLLVLISAICNYILIRSENLTLLLAVALMSITVTLFAIVLCAFPVSASIHAQSGKFIKSSMNVKMTGGLSLVKQKKIKAARPLRIQVGQIFMRKVTRNFQIN